jgi:hypothetical protein
LSSALRFVRYIATCHFTVRSWFSPRFSTPLVTGIGQHDGFRAVQQRMRLRDVGSVACRTNERVNKS